MMRILSGLRRGRGWFLWLMAAGLLLNACGSPPATGQATLAPTGESVPPTVTAAPTASGLPTSAPSPAPIATGAMADIPVGFTAEGFPYRGNPDAPVTMVEFSDYQCPFCLRHMQQTSPLLDKNYVATGKVKHVFRDFPIESIHPQAPKAAEAARCAGAQGAEFYWAMHDRLFNGQAQWANQPDAIATFKSYAAALKLDTEKFDTCLDSGQIAAAVQADIEAGMAAGVDGTPAFRINDWVVSGAQPYEVFQQVIDAALRGEQPPPTPTPLPQGANALSADPNRPGYTYSGHAYKGSPDAPIVMIEISDFQCPYCKDHALGQEEQIDKDYVATGKVRIIFFHFLGHRHSQKAGEASECASAQGKFWEMEHLLFEKADEWWPTTDPTSNFKAYARALGLDEARFNACLDDGEQVQKVQQDHNIVIRAGINGSPSFVINDQLLQGSPPYETWKQILDQLLSSRNP